MLCVKQRQIFSIAGNRELLLEGKRRQSLPREVKITPCLGMSPISLLRSKSFNSKALGCA